MFENNYLKLNTDKCLLIVSGYKNEQVWANIGKDLKFEKHVLKLCSKAKKKVLFLKWRNCFLSIKAGHFLMLLWSLNLKIVQLFGCFIVTVPTTKLKGYMREPLKLFMMTTSRLLINYWPWKNLSVFKIKISRSS